MSKIDRVLLFAFSHQTVIIELIFAIILGIVVMWLFSNIRGESGESQAGVNVKDIEKALKRVLESTDIKVATTQAASLIKDDDDILAPSSGPGLAPRAPSDPAEIAKLKVEMENKSKKLTEVETALNQAKEELTKAKAAGAAAGAGGGATGAPGVNTDELQAKIRSLESRLSEYEIIEDDIANLSLYKEENTKLKAEMNKLKGGSGEVTPTVAPAPAAAVNPTPPPPSAPVEAPAPVAAIDSDKLVKEFDNLVARENAATQAAPVAAAPSPTPAPAVNAPTSPSTGETGDAGEKLIEEFENFVKGTNT